jgi:membrane peptidoglycan carboxypeptidase
MGPRWRLVAIVVALAFVLPVAALAWAWLATPGVDDLGHRVALRQTRVVALGSIAPIVVDALIATEDERFRSNSGIDVIGLMRAIPYDATHLSLAQGGSTLTEQLAKNLWLGGNDGRVGAKLRDMALALKLDHAYSKNEILDAYLNTAYFGQGAYGIAAASRRYFGVTPAALSDEQATVLVGLVQAPSSYDPYTHPAAARRRQISVLRSLVRVGRLRAAGAAKLLAEPLQLADGRTVPGITGVDLSTGPAVAWTGIALALLAALAALGALVARRRASHPLVARLATAATTVLVGGALVIAVRSLRVI